MPTGPGRTPCTGSGLPDPAAGRLVVVGLGHVGLALVRDAITAGYRAIGYGPEPARISRLIGRLSDEDAAAAVLRDGTAAGRCSLTDDAASLAGFDVAVVTPTGLPADPAEPDAVESAAAALAPHLRPGALVVLDIGSRPSGAGELLAATVELLTGLRAGPDYALGYGLAHLTTRSILPDDTTIVSGVDEPSAVRTGAFYRGLGRPSAVVTPVEAAEFVSLLQHALNPARPLTPGDQS